MAGNPWLFQDWFKAPVVTKLFTSATCPYEIASDEKILEVMSSSGLLRRSVKNGKITQITCFDSNGSFRDDSPLNHEKYTPENVKKLMVYRVSALTYTMRRMYVHVVS